MPKKKQVIFQNNIPGKFIPRDDLPSAPVPHSGTSNNRFNSKMAELLASSSATVNNENESNSNGTKSTEDNSTLPASPEVTTFDSSRVHSKLLHRRIVTMLETLRGRGGNASVTSAPTSPRSAPSHVQSKAQPITFGQLRQATASQPSTVEEVSSPKVSSARSYIDLVSVDTQEKRSYHTNLASGVAESCSDLISATSVPIKKSTSKHQANKERLYYSASIEQLLEQHNVVPRSDESRNEEHQPKPPLTVDQILATYYSKVTVPTTTESPPPPSSYPNANMGFYIHSSSSGWNSSQSNPHLVPAPRLVLNEQNRNRPPPPSYSSSVASGHRPPPTANNLAKHLIRSPVSSSVLKHLYSGPQMNQHRLSENAPVATLPTSSSSAIKNPSIDTSVRPAPPRYEQPTSNIERSHSALSSMNRPNFAPLNPPQTGFDREFSRLLYGRDGEKKRHQRQKRKAFSDPVKKSVEEAGRSVEKTHRRLTTHLNKTDTVTEEEETGSDSYEIDKHEPNLLPQRRFQRQSDVPENNRDSARKPIVPANPVLKQRIPSFLRVYSQVEASNDILLQWHLFSLSELGSFDRMMTKLYKDENLTRVQLYENYRALLVSTLASKTSSTNEDFDDDSDVITTTAL